MAKHYACDPHTETREPVVGPTGTAALAPTTLIAPFKAAASGKLRTTRALVQEVVDANGKPTGKLREYTWEQYYTTCRAFARALCALGVQRFDSVNVLGFNAPEWLIANMGATLAGGIAAGIYTTNGAEACKYISEHSRARVVVVDGAKQLAKYETIAAELEHLKAVVVYDCAGGDDGAERAVAQYKDKLAAAGFKGEVITFKAFLGLGSRLDNGENKKYDAEVEERMVAAKPSECCLLIYTSGTTGNPKAVMISHDNATWTVQAGLKVHQAFIESGKALRVVSSLPLSHIAAQHADVHAPIVGAGIWERESTTFFARPDALKGSLKETLLLAKPTIFFGVPRVWTKFQEGMLKVGKAVPAPLRWLSAWAKWVGKADYDARVSGQSPVRGCQWWLADKLVFSSIRRALGLDKCRLLVSGAAPVPLDTLAYFGSVGMHLLEVYGMSENSGPAIMGRNHLYAPGSIGLPLPATELRLDHVEGRDRKGEGELLMRGRHIMLGYLHDEVKTRGAIDEDGWLHSGDVCSANPKTGALYITGRIKELLITEGGENVAPVPIEDKLKELLPAVSNVMVIGDKRKYLTCLVTLHQRGSELEGFENELAGESRRLFKGVTTVAAAASSRGWSGYLMTGLSAYNQTHAVSNAQRVQKFAIVPDFDVPSGLMTATLKMQRPKILQHYEALIDDTLYGGAKAA
uniref:AMP-dependent synthetase/ligase domain-containing protein n=1 Tax=Prasinoderma singulare TaxID=676789 RepID=A0A7S3FK49_9VIRI|mmetsp:Transcript_7655/g.23336  ORF Transcript_7655/g.23336 Transcript_7655/m.23336 type:complete len:691 (+) Transcript_7655:53-2125(+)